MLAKDEEGDYQRSSGVEACGRPDKRRRREITAGPIIMNVQRPDRMQGKTSDNEPRRSDDPESGERAEECDAGHFKTNPCAGLFRTAGKADVKKRNGDQGVGGEQGGPRLRPARDDQQAAGEQDAEPGEKGDFPCFKGERAEHVLTVLSAISRGMILCRRKGL